MSSRKSLQATIIILLFIMLAGICGSFAQVEREVECPVRFAIFGDRTAGHIPGIYGQIAVEIERLKPDFVMTVGDMIEEEVDDSMLIIRNWHEYDSLIKPISAPIYYTPGNNDIWSDLSEELYLRFAGETYYSFDYKFLHMVILDNSRWGSGSDLPAEQIAWLRDDLEKNRNAAYTMAFYHRPFWAEEVALGKPDALHNIFREYGVDAVFTGHYHEYFSGEYDGIAYTGLGSSGGGVHPCASEIDFHFVWVTVDKGGIHITPIQMGAVMAWDETTAEDKNAYDLIRHLGLGFENPVAVKEDMSVELASVSLNVDNSYSKYSLNDTLCWSIPEAWTIEPQTMLITIPSGESRRFDFQAGCRGPLYPLPSVKAEFIYAEGKSIIAEHDLWIARKAYCHPVTEDWELDGEINEPFWREPVELLYNPEGQEMDIDPVKFYFAYDTGNLYIAAYCLDNSENSPNAGARKHDGPVYAEDCVGFFFEPKEGSDTIFQIYINPIGTVFDMRITRGEDGWMNYDPEWNGRYEVKAIMEDNFWSLEAKIPVDQFNTRIEKGKDWHLNFRRKQKALKSAADWQVPIDADPKTMGLLIIK